jgi:hypothetical protein
MGLPEILRFWEQMAGAWVELVIEPLEFTEAPDQLPQPGGLGAQGFLDPERRSLSQAPKGQN